MPAAASTSRAHAGRSRRSPRSRASPAGRPRASKESNRDADRRGRRGACGARFARSFVRSFVPPAASAAGDRRFATLPAPVVRPQPPRRFISVSRIRSRSRESATRRSHARISGSLVARKLALRFQAAVRISCARSSASIANARPKRRHKPATNRANDGSPGAIAAVIRASRCAPPHGGVARTFLADTRSSSPASIPVPLPGAPGDRVLRAESLLSLSARRRIDAEGAIILSGLGPSSRRFSVFDVAVRQNGRPRNIVRNRPSNSFANRGRCGRFDSVRDLDSPVGAWQRVPVHRCAAASHGGSRRREWRGNTGADRRNRNEDAFR